MESETPSSPGDTPFKRVEGVTESERYLGWLGQQTFLSLWSYQGTYRDEKKISGKGHGKEVCDLLVVFENHILIFSDKLCKFKASAKPEVAWLRWFKSAVAESANQLWGAEKWIRKHPNRVFLDRECNKSLPIDLPEPAKATFHLIAVANGTSEIIRATYGGSGSLMINTMVRGIQSHITPFYIGDLDPAQRFVHVFDEESLTTVLQNRDTISEFIHYLCKREILLRGKRRYLATGEEQLLAIYLTQVDEQGDHDFLFPPSSENADTIHIPEGYWEDFLSSPQRKEQLKRNEVSYSWDQIIEKFAYYALQNKQYYTTGGGVKEAERILRFMAAEPRWIRRELSLILHRMLTRTNGGQRLLNVLPPLNRGSPYYVFLMFPQLKGRSEEDYRHVRREFLISCCRVTKLAHPNALDIVGFATESGRTSPTRTEDAIYMDVREWTPEMNQEAVEEQKQLQILTSAKQFETVVKEYPDPPVLGKLDKNPRNKPCPCGSGLKFKRCCG